jgi:hypothetical protein
MKIFLIAVNVKEDSQHIEDHAFRKVITESEEEAKQIVFEELSEDWNFEDFEDFEYRISFCEEIDTTTPVQQFGDGY